MDVVFKNGFAHDKRFPSQGILDDQTCLLKMILAISLILEGNGQSEMGFRLFESVREKADRALHSENIEIKTLPFLVLVVGSSQSLFLARVIFNLYLVSIPLPL